jgi:DHA2 family lincomycin resistance protein-like MFS transporter
MSVTSAALMAEGVGEVEALAQGIRSAFLVGAIISLGSVAAAFFVRKPPEQPGARFQGGH